MQTRHPHLATTLIPLLLLAACAQERPDESEPAAAATDAAAEESSLPDISRAAPGVAFSFAYDFRLPSDKIRAVQQGHAALCANLGLDRAG